MSDDFALRARGLWCSPPKSLSENGEGFCLGEKGSIGKARGGSRPAAVCDRQATPPAGPSLPNPPGGGSFRLGLRWFGRNRPQEVCPAAHRLAQPRIPQPQDPSPFSDRLYARSSSIPLCIGSLCGPLTPVTDPAAAQGPGTGGFDALRYEGIFAETAGRGGRGLKGAGSSVDAPRDRSCARRETP